MKNKIKLLSIIILLVFLASSFTFCKSERITASKYTQDQINLKDGSKYKGDLSGYNQNSSHAQILTNDNIIRIIPMKEVDSVYFSDKIRNRKTRETIQGSIESEEGSDTIVIVLSNGAVKRIKKTEDLIIERTGTKKKAEINPIDELMKIWEDMGVKNIVSTNDEGKVNNGWLYTILGVLVVFAALSLMLIAFFLLKFVRGGVKKTAEKTVEITTSEKKTKEGGIEPEVISAITLALSLEEDTDEVVLTIDRAKSRCSNWAYAGRMDNASRFDF